MQTWIVIPTRNIIIMIINSPLNTQKAVTKQPAAPYTPHAVFVASAAYL